MPDSEIGQHEQYWEQPEINMFFQNSDNKIQQITYRKISELFSVVKRYKLFC
jgi:hypothetical protein